MRHARCVLLLVASLCLASVSAASAGDKRERVKLIEDLDHKDSEVRFLALVELERRGRDALPAIGRVVELLADPSQDVRLASCMVLGRLGKPAVGRLAEQLAHKDEEVLFYTLWALEKIGADAADAADKTGTLLDHSSDDLRRRAMRALAVMGTKAHPVLKKRLESGDVKTQALIVSAMSEAGPAARDVLLHAFRKARPEVRVLCLEPLARYGVADDDVVLALGAALTGGDNAVRQAAARGLSGLGGAGTRAFPYLLQALFDEDASVRAEAGEALSRQGAEIGPGVRKLLDSSDERTRLVAARLLLHRDNKDADAIKVLQTGLKFEDNSLRTLIARALIEARVTEGPLVEALLCRRKELDTEGRFRLLQALCILGEKREDAMAAMPLFLEDPDPVMRSDVTRFLKGMSPRNRFATKALAEVVSKSKDNDARARALGALGEIGAAARDVRDVIEAATRDGDGTVSAAAKEALTRIGS